MSSHRTFTSLCLGAVALTLTAALGRAENVSITVSKVAELPITFVGETPAEWTANSPQSPRGGILQVGTDLWFTTYSGGDRGVGTIVSYSLVTQQFTTQHSFGLQDPDDPATTRLDGYNPWKTTLTLGSDGRIYYAATYGGGNVSANGETNGGVIGSFTPSTVRSDGVNVLWYGSTSSSTNPQNLGYTSPILMPNANGTTYVYFNTYGGGANSWGTVQRLTLDVSGNYIAGSQLQVTELLGPNGRQSQANMLQVGTKLYYVSASAATNVLGNAIPTLRVIDTTKVGVPNDPAAISQVNITNWSVGSVGSWSKPIYDAERNAIYSLTLSAGILKFDLTTGVANPQSLLDGSADGSAGNFADPILFGDSIYYVKQNSGTGVNSGGQIWRYDLDENKLYAVLNLNTLGGIASSQSGTLSKVVQDGVESLYFLTASDANGAGTNGAQLGAMYKIAVTTVPEPGSIVMLLVGGLAVGTRRFRRSASNLS